MTRLKRKVQKWIRVLAAKTKIQTVLNKVSKTLPAELILQINIYAIQGKELRESELSLLWNHIKNIHEAILVKDPNWHMFFEGYYFIVRCSASFYDDVLRYLDTNDITYKEKGLWIDEQSTTRRNQDLYQLMFHAFSELAMRNEAKNITFNLDRVVHCFLNHQFLALHESGVIEKYGVAWEPSLISQNLINRALFVGSILGAQEERKKREGEENE